MPQRQITGCIRRRGRDAEEARRLAEARRQVQDAFPSREPPRLRPATSGTGAEIRRARQAQGLSWYALAERAGIPDASTVRDPEYGRDVKLSNVDAGGAEATA